MADTIIKVNNITKSFVIPHERQNTIKSRFVNPFKKVRKTTFDALKDINFEIKKGEFVGLIGRNGSGKSTMLKLVAGVYEPTSGSIEVNGTLVPFLELGVGFNPDLTGRENVYLNGAILGMTHRFMEEKMEEIIEFAELEEFIDMQTKNYSSGMMIRLAFSVAAQVKADIYLLDEVLGVGDIGFQKKSLAKMKELLSGGSTVLYVSHAADSIREHCDRVIYLQNGRKIFDGDTNRGLVHYELSFLESEEEKEKYLKDSRAQEIEALFMDEKSNIDKANKDKSEIEKILMYERYKLGLMNEEDGELFTLQKKKTKQLETAVNSSGEIDMETMGAMERSAKLISFDLQGGKAGAHITCKVGDSLSASLEFEVTESIERPVVALCFMKNDMNIQVINTPRNKNNIVAPLQSGDKLKVSFDGVLKLNPGIYDVRLHLGDPKIHDGGRGGFAYLNNKIAKLIVTSEEIPNPETWSFRDNPVDYSGLVQNKFTYNIDIQHE